MLRYVFLVLLLVSPVAGMAQDVSWKFQWQGAGGYALRGGLSYDPRRLEGPLVVEGDLTCFFVEGFREGALVGRWGLEMLTEQTDWRLHMDPESGQFLVYGMGLEMPQAWNMDGSGTSCGAGGFGFNIGNAAQDLCIDGALIVESQVDPIRPFAVERDSTVRFPAYACHGPDLLSSLRD